MDKAGLRMVGKIAATVLFAIVVVSCTREAPLAKKATQTPAASPQLTPEPLEVRKPVNVSFSTYSKEWPVNWQWIDPDEASEPTIRDVKKGVLRINVPSKKYLRDNRLIAPRYVKSIKGDFQIETRVKFLPKENYQGAGLLILKDDNSYLRFERAYGGSGGGSEGIMLEACQAGECNAITTTADLHTELTEVDLKLVRSGNVFIAYWREDQEHPWREAGEYASDYPESIMAGVVAVNTARPVVTEFAYIKLLPGTTEQK